MEALQHASLALVVTFSAARALVSRPQLESKERSLSKHEAPEEEERFAGFYLSPKRDYFDFSSGNHICATAGVTQHLEHLKGTD